MSIETSVGGRPGGVPIGMRLDRAAKVVSRAFDDALSAAGASLPAWRILLALKSGRSSNQRELAGAVGIRGATLTHHLDAMEGEGLLTRRRDPENRRVHLVELTPRGEAAFQTLRGAATAFDQRLRAGFSAEEIATLEGLLDRMVGNVSAVEGPGEGPGEA